MEEIVKTISGENHIKNKCRLINGDYYLIGDTNIENSGDVFLIDTRYIRLNTNRLIFDNSDNTYKLKNNSFIKGIIKFNKDEPVYGYFSKQPYNVYISLKTGIIHNCISKKIIPLSYREHRGSGYYFHITVMSVEEFNQLEIVDRVIKEALPYDSKGITESYVQNYDKNYNPLICDSVKKYSNILKNYTFGFEFETTKGILNASKLKELPLIPLRDGSISGLEYVTIPLKEAKGLQSLINCVSELKKRTEYDVSCSMHLHIGGIPRTPSFILAFWKFISRYQNEIFEMFPLYKKYNFDVKRKNYSKPLPVEKLNLYLDSVIDDNNVNKNFNVLFKYLSEGDDFNNYDNDLKNVKFHHRDPNGNQKWNIKNRYYFTNLIPLIFGNKQTIEFRIHTPTYDINKIINFLIMNIAIINVVSRFEKQILQNNFKEIFEKKFASFLSYYLQNYNTNIRDEISRYVNVRKEQTYFHNSQGKINYNEDSLKFRKNIIWKSSEEVQEELFNVNTENDLKIEKPIFFDEEEVNNYFKEQVENLTFIPSVFRINSKNKYFNVNDTTILE